jgi:uncharacterized membrane protein
MDTLEALIRWTHVIAGITWIGLLYFFNWVNSAFAPTMDGETKKKVVPELMPRALYWFRWGAAWTWITGFLLLLIVYYHTGVVFEAPNGWGFLAFVALVVTFFGFVAYDLICGAISDNRTLAAVGIVLTAVAFLIFSAAGFGYRGCVIHVGALYGTIMAANVWMRIWPAQRRIIAATRDGVAADPADAAMAGRRSKHNTYLSVPLVWAMLNQHTLTAGGSWAGLPTLLLAVAIGWGVVNLLYKKATQVKGF